MDFVVWECERYTCKHFGYSDCLPSVDVGKFLLFEPHKFLCLFVYFVCGFMSTIELTSTSASSI